jgi:hypothetical protein
MYNREQFVRHCNSSSALLDKEMTKHRSNATPSAVAASMLSHSRLWRLLDQQALGPTERLQMQQQQRRSQQQHYLAHQLQQLLPHQQVHLLLLLLQRLQGHPLSQLQ